MKQIINKILNTGVCKYNNVKENKKIKLLNIFCFTWAIMILVITFFDILFQRELIDSLKIHGVSYVLIFIIFYLQKTRFYTLSRVLFITAIIGVTYVFANYVTPFSLIENFYFIYPLIAIILIEKKWINLGILLLCFLLYFVPNFYFKHYPETTILPVLIFSVFVATYVILSYAENLNKKHEKELLKSKKSLEQAYLELEERKKSEVAALQLKALKTQMNPHFLFNSINAIQNLILTDKKTEAYTYLTKFSLFVRESIKASEESYVAFDAELSMLKKYLELEKLRFGNDFVYEFVGEELIEKIKIPSAIIQPFIENAVRCGLLHKTNGVKKVTVEFKQGDLFQCIVLDNGIGIDASKEITKLNQEETVSKATDLVEKRLLLLKEYYQTDIGVKYEDVHEGTKVIIRIPYSKLS